MSEELELFDLPEGGKVATGLLLPNASTVKFEAPEYPESEFLEDSDIKRALSGNFYLEERKRFAPYVINQDSVGKCNPSAVVGGFYQINDNNGFPIVPLADNQLYWRTNGGADNGSVLADTFREVQERGISRRVLHVNGKDYRIGDNVVREREVPREVAEAASADALSNRAFEAYKVPKTWSKFVRCVASALARRNPIVFAWHVGRNSMKLDSRGYVVQGRGPGNHANLAQSGKWVGGETLIHIDDRNSWGPSKNPIFGPMGTSWGEGGFGLFTMESFFQCIAYHDFFVLTSRRDDAKNPILRNQ